MEASTSAPGPDGIPFEAFKATPDLSARVIKLMIDSMVHDPELDMGATFNRAWLALLPKKPKLIDPIKGDIYIARTICGPSQ